MDKFKKFISIFIWVFAFFISIFPLILLVFTSIAPGWPWPEIIPKKFSLAAWKYVIYKNPKTLDAILTSLKIALSVAIINLIISIPAADALGRYDFKGKQIIESIILLPIIVPSIISSMGVHKHFIKLNLTDSILGVIICHVVMTLPYMVRAIAISFAHLGFEIVEQARVLGATKIYSLVHVVFPFILPGIIAGTSVTILVSLSQYIITLLVGGGNIVTLPILMFPYINGGDQSVGAVYSILFALISATLLFIMDSFLKKIL